jgi:cytochrome c-type biogenesis protein CcmH
MIIFWILAAGLLGLASLFVALPLLKRPSPTDAPRQDELNLQVFRQRLTELDGDLAAGFLDQGQYDAARRDLERELLYDLDGDPTQGNVAPATTPPGTNTRYPGLALALVLLVCAGAVLMYLRLGEREIIPQIEAMSAALTPHEGTAPGKGAAPLDVLVKGLAERMEKNPDDVGGWLMLGRTYFALGQAPKALEAMERAYQLAPEQSDVALSYAQAVASNNGNRLAGRPAELIQGVLAKEPGNPTARWLDGMLAYQQARFADAAGTWQGLLNDMDPAGEEAQQLRQLIGQARNRAGLPDTEASPGIALAQAAAEAPPTKDPTSEEAQAKTAAARPDTAGDAAGAQIQVAVNLDPSLAAQAAPGDTVFVYARAAAGPPMPLAVQRLRVSDLPVTLTLDDSMAVMPAMRLSTFPQVVVGARISKSGQATPQSGDLEGQSDPIVIAETPQVSVTIDRPRP